MDLTSSRLETTEAPPPDTCQTPPRPLQHPHTDDAYGDWAGQFILFHCERHRREMGATELEQFLTHLAMERKIAASTQNQAKSA